MSDHCDYYYDDVDWDECDWDWEDYEESVYLSDRVVVLTHAPTEAEKP